MSASSFRFATIKITNQVFFQSPLSLGIVNLKPLVPGHVLVIPKRVIARFNDLTTDEVTDLFLSVQRITRVLEREYRAGALTIACQDGPLAGQSVPHTHVHIMPRHPGDFKPLDAIYSALDGVNFQEDYARRKTRDDRLQARAGVDAEEDRAARSGEEMREEAERLSLLFPEDVRGTFD